MNTDTDETYFDIDVKMLSNGLRTKYKSVSLSYLIESLKKLESGVHQNIKEGTASVGNHKNSKTTSSHLTKD